MRLLLTRAQRFDFHPRWACRITNALLVGKVRNEEDHAISRWMMRVYEPLAAFEPRCRRIAQALGESLPSAGEVEWMVAGRAVHQRVV